MGAMSYANSTDCWFLPTSYSDHATSLGRQTIFDGHVASMTDIPSMQRFRGRLHECKKVFIPIHDKVEDHWYLAVLNVAEGECEIWDSNIDLSMKKRQEEYAKCTIDLFRQIFAEDFNRSPDLPSVFVFQYPTSCPIQRKKEESGIYVIRNMQHYGKRWYDGFNPGDQRVRIALEIVGHPLNEYVGSVWANLYKEQKERAAEAIAPHDKVSTGGGEGGRIPPLSKKFKPRVPARW
ncbi:uncharacterized protein LOC126803313 [Argentina anserina]|uniref:uncharacterized protein LOC126803313 n=1 Tax=Argentina anserina TaxID=57926 RepID=UPI0021764477|nr:uncharacterized protein LOC126803313 [Potentilla anserina]